MFNIQTEHKNKFGDLIICLDKADKGYWRKDVYPPYKGSRKGSREKSEIKYDEVFKYINELIDQLRKNTPFKVIEVNRAEADDIMLVLAKEFCEHEKIMIHSPDKDMIQCQRYSDNVFQYSALTRKWLVPEAKYDDMDQWLLEHVCLGDAADEVPKVVDHTEFSESFLSFIEERGYNFKSPYEMIQLNKSGKLNGSELKVLFDDFGVFKINKKGESLGKKDIYADIRFGPSVLHKEIAKHGSLENWLASHPLYKEHYDRNFKLVMDDGIPNDIWNDIIVEYKECKTDYNINEFESYLDSRNLGKIKQLLPNVFKLNRELTLEDFDW